jgi:hypothetical protein
VFFYYWKEVHQEVDWQVCQEVHQEVDQLGVSDHWEVDRVVVVF